jgi:hypothetical protein
LEIKLFDACNILPVLKQIIMMRKFLIAAALFFAVGSATEIQAQFVVKIRPTFVVRSRPMAPSAAHIWIEPEWVWRNGNYVMIDGYWATSRPGFMYYPGRWRRHRGGFIWVAGGWRRR